MDFKTAPVCKKKSEKFYYRLTLYSILYYLFKTPVVQLKRALSAHLRAENILAQSIKKSTKMETLHCDYIIGLFRTNIQINIKNKKRFAHRHCCTKQFSNSTETNKQTKIPPKKSE